MHQWTVGGAVLEGPDGWLLVENRRRHGVHDWTPPGGVIDEGELMIVGLAREVNEETGLVVTEWIGPVYEINAVAPGLGWHLRVEVWHAVAFTGEVTVGDDPDGIVVGAGWFAAEACAERLALAHPWVREPFTEYLGERWTDLRSFDYRVDGTDYRNLDITRL